MADSMSKTSMSNCFSINVVPLNPLKFSDDDINEIGKLTVPKKRMRSNPFEKVDFNNINLIGELKCPVCTELCSNPRECHTCGHLFCGACIAPLKSCPLCRMETLVTRESRFAHRLLNQVRVKCVQCEALVVRAQLEEHERTCAAQVRFPAAQFPQGQSSFQAFDSLVTIKRESVDDTSKEYVTSIEDNSGHQVSTIAPGVPGLLPVVAGISKLRLFSRIQPRNQQSPISASLSFAAMCALSGEVLLVSRNKKGLRTLSLQSGVVSPRAPFEMRRVTGMALDTRTDTLLLVQRPTRPEVKFWWLASIRRVDWYVVELLSTEFELSINIQDIVVCESRVLLGTQNYSYLRAFDVSAEHKLRPVGDVVVNTKFRHFACTHVDADTLVAFSHQTSVSLQRLVGLQLEPLAEIAFSQLSRLLFRGQLLLGIGWNKDRKDNIVSFLVTGTRLNLQPQMLLDFNASVKVGHWCIAGDRLVVQDGASNDLLVYDFD